MKLLKYAALTLPFLMSGGIELEGLAEGLSHGYQDLLFCVCEQRELFKPVSMSEALG